jgi:hypothetical protein
MSEPKKAQATTLVELAQERYRFAMSTEGKPFAVELDGPNIARMLRGGHDSLRAELAMRFVEEHESAPSSEALSSALLVLTGKAMQAPREQLHLRFARDRDGLWIDLGDEKGRAVLVKPGRGWELVAAARPLFHRTALTEAMPVPERGGDLAELRSLLNITDEGWDLVRAWLVAAMLPDQPAPILLTRGLQGTGKSTHARLLAELVDPSAAPLRCAPRDVEQWSVAAGGSRVVALDNLSSLSADLSDALCRAVTGDALIKRELYSDGGLFVLRFQRALILTSIEMGSMRGDLADRMVVLDLEPIAREGRRLDGAIQAAFLEARPRLLGALLDLVAAALGKLPDVQLQAMERMADFSRLAAAVDQVLGTDALGAYVGQRASIAEEVVAGDTVADKVAGLVPNHGDVWRDSATKLLEEITPEPPPKGWPATAHHLTGRLRRVIGALEGIGVMVEFSREGKSGTRTIRVARPALKELTKDGELFVLPLPIEKERQQRQQRQPDADSYSEPGLNLADAGESGASAASAGRRSASASTGSASAPASAPRPDVSNTNGTVADAADAADAVSRSNSEGVCCPRCRGPVVPEPGTLREARCPACRRFVSPVAVEVAHA